MVCEEFLNFYKLNLKFGVYIYFFLEGRRGFIVFISFLENCIVFFVVLRVFVLIDLLGKFRFCCI